MKFPKVYIEKFENNSNEPVILHEVIRVLPGARIVRSTFHGPVNMERISLIGPNSTMGKYTSLNQDAFIIRTTVGAFCAIGARSAINPFNHPIDWFSIHEFQYHPTSYGWVPEYNTIDRIPRTPRNHSNGQRLGTTSGSATMSTLSALASVTALLWRLERSSPRTCRPTPSSRACLPKSSATDSETKSSSDSCARNGGISNSNNLTACPSAIQSVALT